METKMTAGGLIETRSRQTAVSFKYMLIRLIVAVVIVILALTFVIAGRGTKEERANNVSKAQTAAADASIRAHLANARPYAEIYFDEQRSYAGFCQSSSFIDIQNAIYRVHPTAQINCKDDATSYAVSVTLASGPIICTDNTMSIVTKDTLNTGTSCAQ